MFSVIFDMDGTLLDTQRDYIPAWDRAGERFGIKNAGQYVTQLLGVNEAKSKEFIREKMPGVDPAEFRRIMREELNKILVIRYREGVKELLDFLKSRGVLMAVASGSERPVIHERLSAVDAEHYFDIAVGGMDVQNGKPAPDIFLLAAQKLGVDPKDCIVFEDSDNGILAAHKAGMKCIGFPDLLTFTQDIKDKLYAEITDMRQAIPILEELMK